jgi:galactokinase/mevalonate kinase-like predicted kinase
MKTLKTLLLLSLIAAGTDVSARSNGTGSQGLSTAISKQLSQKQLCTMPASDTKVKVDFRINEQGNVDVIKVHTDDPSLKTEVNRQFRSLKLKDASADTGKVYSITVKYTVI